MAKLLSQKDLKNKNKVEPEGDNPSPVIPKKEKKLGTRFVMPTAPKGRSGKSSFFNSAGETVVVELKNGSHTISDDLKGPERQAFIKDLLKAGFIESPLKDEDFNFPETESDRKKQEKIDAEDGRKLYVIMHPEKSEDNLPTGNINTCGRTVRMIDGIIKTEFEDVRNDLVNNKEYVEIDVITKASSLKKWNEYFGDKTVGGKEDDKKEEIIDKIKNKLKGKDTKDEDFFKDDKKKGDKK